MFNGSVWISSKELAYCDQSLWVLNGSTLARALYAHKPIAVLDDVLSGLDAGTHDIVTTRVFGADGLIRKLGMAAILATHSVSLCAVADQTIILDDQGQIIQQSSSENMDSLTPQLAGDNDSSGSSTKRDDSRQVGDLSIYLYYVSSMGWLSFALFGIFVTSNVASSTLQFAALAIVAVSYFAAVLPFVVCALFCLQRFYLRTSRQLRLLDLEAKAPLYSHVLESLQGIATIRAYGWTSNHIAKNIAILDRAQKPYYLLLCIQRWLTLVLGLTVAGLAILLTTLGVTLRSRLDAGFLGVALVSMMNIGQSLAALITFRTLLETSLGAISRVKTFSEDTPTEKPREIMDSRMIAGWPSQGSVVIENWSAHYNGHPVLRNIDISIQAGEKVAICGRTGR
ncbi:ABC transporter [Colletotrichum graminicola]|nr:ABC transporter [Colletotrichum graminicola]